MCLTSRWYSRGHVSTADGNLLFSDVYGGHVFRLTPDRRLSTVFSEKKLGPGGLAIHKDGRIFIAAVGDLNGSGSIVAVRPDGSGRQTIVSSKAGYVPNDLVSTAGAGSTSPISGASPPILRAVPTTSRATSRRSRQCCRISRRQTLSASALPVRSCGSRSSVEISCTGSNWRPRQRSRRSARPLLTSSPAPTPDSMRADSDGNLYVAMYGQGRVLVFNKKRHPDRTGAIAGKG
jgi:lactonase